MIVTFCERAEIAPTDNVHSWLQDILVSLILDGADTFYLGGYGAFDRLAFAMLRKLKKTYPHIQIILVLAYLNRNIDTSGYDVTLYPELEKTPARFAISKRNEKMADMADTVVAYVTHNWSRAAKTLQYAKRKEKIFFAFLIKPVDYKIHIIEQHVTENNHTMGTRGKMRYDISNAASLSNLSLFNFFWHDRIPTKPIKIIIMRRQINS